MSDSLVCLHSGLIVPCVPRPQRAVGTVLKASRAARRTRKLDTTDTAEEKEEEQEADEEAKASITDTFTLSPVPAADNDSHHSELPRKRVRTRSEYRSTPNKSRRILPVDKHIPIKHTNKVRMTMFKVDVPAFLVMDVLTLVQNSTM